MNNKVIIITIGILMISAGFIAGIFYNLYSIKAEKQKNASELSCDDFFIDNCFRTTIGLNTKITFAEEPGWQIAIEGSSYDIKIHQIALSGRVDENNLLEYSANTDIYLEKYENFRTIYSEIINGNELCFKSDLVLFKKLSVYSQESLYPDHVIMENLINLYECSTQSNTSPIYFVEKLYSEENI